MKWVGGALRPNLRMSAATLCFLFAGATLLLGQDPQARVPEAQPPADPPATAIPAQTPAPAATTTDKGDEGRILGLIPQNKTVPPRRKYTEEPLSTGEKFQLALKDTIDPFTFVLAGFYSGIAQWQDDFPTWGLGSVGYAHRFGAAYADQAVGNYLTEAIFPSMLHEDPRYFRKGTGSKWSRFDYALMRILITRTDSGGDGFNYSEIVGNAVASGISTAYYPASERNLGETAQKFAYQIASDAAFNVLLEFWPEMRHTIFRRQ